LNAFFVISLIFAAVLSWYFSSEILGNAQRDEDGQISRSLRLGLTAFTVLTVATAVLFIFNSIHNSIWLLHSFKA